MTFDGNLFIVHHYESSSFTRFVPASISVVHYCNGIAYAYL